MKVHRDVKFQAECRPDNLVPTSKFLDCTFIAVIALCGFTWEYLNK